MIEPWIEEYKKDGLTLNTLNKLYSYWYRVNYSFNWTSKPKVIIQLGRREYEGLSQCSYLPNFKPGTVLTKKQLEKFNCPFMTIGEILNCEFEKVNRDSYLWIREKL